MKNEVESSELKDFMEKIAEHESGLREASLFNDNK